MAIDPQTIIDLIPIYQENIDALIESMGKTVTLYFESTVVAPANSEVTDLMRNTTKKPAYKSSDAPVVTENTDQIKALIRYNPSDFQHYGLRIDKPTGLVRLKTYLSDVPNLIRCKYIVPNDASRGIIETRYRLVREPIPIGLGVDRYAVSFWERI